MRVPTCDLARAYEGARAEFDDAARRVLSSGTYLLGGETAGLEAEFSAWCGVGHGVGVGNGTDALQLALQGCGIRAGDVVATVSHTAVATVAGIRLAGATPLLVDVDPTTYVMTGETLITALDRWPGPAPVAVVPVHLYGQPAPMPAICAIARDRNMRVIEDCAQAHGATVNGVRVGSFGDAAAFSFYPTKNLGAFGDAGMVVTDDRQVAERIRRLHQYGWVTRSMSEEPGLNSRIDELQAAFLRVSLRLLEQRNRRRKEVADHYQQHLSGLTELVLPHAAPDSSHAWHQYVVQHPRRSELARHLEGKGIQTAVHYPVPVHLQRGYAAEVVVPDEDSLTVTERIVERILSLPIYPELDDAQLAYVSTTVSEYLA